MEKFVPFDKMSKKKKKEINALKRKTWGTLNPVTRKTKNKKAYDRRKARKLSDDFNSALFYS